MFEVGIFLQIILSDDLNLISNIPRFSNNITIAGNPIKGINILLDLADKSKIK